MIRLLLLIFIFSSTAQAELEVSLEAGQVWQNRNDVQIPPDAGGTRVELDEFGDGPYSAARLDLFYRFGSKHGVRLLYAPLTVEFDGTPTSNIDFDGTTFNAGTLTDFEYTFNSYRLTYFYALWGHKDDQLNIGFTAKVRDAEIVIRQGSTEKTYDNTGFVPLLFVDYQKKLGQNWKFKFNMDGLAGGPGRAFDVALKFRRALSKSTDLGIGYRTLEGGADNDEVFTFSWLNYAVIDLTARF